MPRSLDVVLSLAALVALSPLVALIAALNYGSTRAVLYRQVRIGRHLDPFVILKFQTMEDGAERGGSITSARDTRITSVGRFLRMLKLDELPQLMNVLRGEMSLVGPRALTPNEVAQVPGPVARHVYAVRPGMTGLASLVLTDEERVLAGADDPVAFYYQVVLPQKMAWESLYVRRRSFWLDLIILIFTPLAIVFPGTVRRLFGLLLGGVTGPLASPAGKENA